MPEEKVSYLVLQLKVRSDLAAIIKRDTLEFDTRNANGNIALHFHSGVVQKLHTTQVN